MARWRRATEYQRPSGAIKHKDTKEFMRLKELVDGQLTTLRKMIALIERREKMTMAKMPWSTNI